MELIKFIEQHGEELLRLSYTYVRNHQMAEDIVQDVLLKAYEKQHEFRGQSSYRTYLYRMTINRSYDYLRSWSYKNTVVSNKIQQLLKGSKSAEHQVLLKGERNDIAEAVFRLEVAYREVIVLHYYEELKVEEIAAVLQCPVNTVKTRLRRGRDRLKKSLQEGGISYGAMADKKSN